MTIQVLDVNEINEVSGGIKLKAVWKGIKNIDKGISAANTGMDGASNLNVDGNSPGTNAAASAYDVLTYKV